MEEFVRDIVQAVETAFGVSPADDGRSRELAMARRAASLLCMRNGIPARFLASAIGRSRWSVNRWASAAMDEKGIFFWQKVDDVETLLICTKKAHKRNE